MSSTNHAKIQAALSMNEFMPVTISAIMPEEDALFINSCDGNLAELQRLLKDPAMISIVNKCRTGEDGVLIHGRSNLYLMLLLAARAGRAAIIELLLAFASNHVLSVDHLVDRDLIFATLDSNNIEVFQKLVDVVPACTNQDLGHSGDPLNQALCRTVYEMSTPQQAIELTSFLLKNGADPNSSCGTAGGGDGLQPNSNLTGACRLAPVEIVELLVQYGARVLQSGALQIAVIKERVDVLDLLLKSGADVNERPPFVFSFEELDEEAKQDFCSGSPLHLAVRRRVPKAASWLLRNGADTTLRDAKGLTALDLARESDDMTILECFKPLL